MRGGWVYIMTNRPNGVLYTGVWRDNLGENGASIRMRRSGRVWA